MQDKFTGKSRGFAFVTMGSEARRANRDLETQRSPTVEGRALTVNEARPRESRPPGGGGGGAAVVAVMAAAGWWPAKRRLLGIRTRLSATVAAVTLPAVAGVAELA